METGHCHPYSKGSTILLYCQLPADCHNISIVKGVWAPGVFSPRTIYGMHCHPPSLLIGNVWVPMMHFCVCRIHNKVHWGVGRRLGSYRFISAQPLGGSTIMEFCISSVLWVSEVLCCKYWHSFYQIDHSMLWCMVAIVEETLTSGKYISLFLISILNIYIYIYEIWRITWKPA